MITTVNQTPLQDRRADPLLQSERRNGTSGKCRRTHWHEALSLKRVRLTEDIAIIVTIITKVIAITAITTETLNEAEAEVHVAVEAREEIGIGLLPVV